MSKLAARAKALNETQTAALEKPVPATPPSWSKRKDMKRAYMWLDKNVKKELQILGIEQGMTEQQLLTQAVNMVLEAYGKTAVTQ